MIKPAAWVPADVPSLESNAERVVREHIRNLLVTAGPGAGKTEILAQRADYLLRVGLCPYPQRILAISFKVDAARNLGDRVRIRCGRVLAKRFDSYTFHAFAKRLVDAYRLALPADHALSSGYSIESHTAYPDQIRFDDLLPLAIEILQTNDYALGGLRQTYSHVFLDEFQDATDQQYNLLKEALIGAESIITAVGDAKQRIMGWAGALDKVFDLFAGDFDASPVRLYQNYRSKPVLRRFQNRMVAVIEPAAVVPTKDLMGDQGLVSVIHYANDTAEAAGLADMIEAWLAGGVKHSDIAVLVRQWPEFVAGTLASELASRGIAHRDEQKRQDLTAEPAAALILDLLRVISGRGQSSAYEQLVRIVSFTGFGDEIRDRAQSAVRRLLAESRLAVASRNFNQQDIGAWMEIVSQFLELITRPVLTGLSPSYQHGTRLDDLIQETRDALAEELALDGSMANALDRLSEDDAIRILTIHKVKGLEFEKVIVLGVEKELFWTSNDSTIHDLRNVFFVAASRAKDELVLTYVDSRSRPRGLTKRWDVSRHPYLEFLGYANDKEEGADEPPF